MGGSLRALALAPLVLAGCFALGPSRGGGQTKSAPPPGGRVARPSDVALPPGYRIEVVAQGLTFPTSVTFDEQGTPYVIEAGYSYGEAFTTPRLLRIEKTGAPTVVATGTNPPWTGVSYHDGAFYVAEGGESGGGRIVRVDRNGAITPLVQGLPSLGDHHTNGAVVGPDGMLYFGQGTATNSGVVGTDDLEFGWLARHPDFHDTPCKDVTLRGINYETDNPLTPDPKDEAVTGAFSAFGTATQPEQVVRGAIPCNGAIFRVPLQGGAPELVAWGFRNPFGLAFSPDGKLYVTDNGYDERGSRPIFGAGDDLWRVEPGIWYGWPDFADGRPVDRRGSAGNRPKPPDALLAPEPGTPPAPVAELGVHSSSNGLDFSRNASFGFVGDAFVAQFGDMAPRAGKVLGPVGFRVVRVNVAVGTIDPFAANQGDRNGPASQLGTGGLERPIDARFDPSGQALYVVDFGVMRMSKEGPAPEKQTGVLWRVVRSAEAPR